MIVTISNEYGSGAVAIAERAAAMLGYEFVDRQLPVVVAKRLRVGTAEVDASEDVQPSVGSRLLSGLGLSTPEVVASPGDDFGAELVREVQVAVREYAARGDVVIVGRGAGPLLGRRPDVLRVFVHAPRDWRVRHVGEGLGVEARVAAAEVDRIDRARRAYLQQWYGVDFGSSHTYDLAFDSATFGEAGSAALIVAAARARG